jgi:hypothetical protein
MTAMLLTQSDIFSFVMLRRKMQACDPQQKFNGTLAAVASKGLKDMNACVPPMAIPVGVNQCARSVIGVHAGEFFECRSGFAVVAGVNLFGQVVEMSDRDGFV